MLSSNLSSTVVLGLLGLALAKPSAADSPPPPPNVVVDLGLAEAQASARQNNPELQAAREAVIAAESRTAEVRGARWPTLGFNLGSLRTDNPSQAFAAKLNAGQLGASDFALGALNRPDAVTQWSVEATVMAPIDAFGKLRSAQAARSAARDAAAADLTEAEADLRLGVEQAYRRAALASVTIATTEQAITAARERESEVSAAVAHGAALEADLLRARARRRQREADLAEHRAERGAALAELQRLLGGPIAELDGVTLERPAEPPPLAGSQELWVERAFASRGLLRSGLATLAAASAAAQAAIREQRPDLSVFATLANDRIALSRGASSALLGASLHWGAFDRARSARIEGAESARRAAEQQAAAARDRVRMEAVVAYRQAVAGRERWQAARGGAEESAEALRVMRERRAAGVATLSDELATESEALAAKLEEERSLTELTLADAALERAAGSPEGAYP
ncbi:MAG: TolC family protein [Acidobacteriota bacterium]